MRATRARASRLRYLAVELDASLDLTRAHVEDCHEVGIHVNQGALTATDLTVRRMRARATDGTWGGGLNVQEGTATLSRARFEEVRETGVLAWGAGTVVTATDLVAIRTLERECAPDDCPEEDVNVSLGMGVTAIQRAHVSLERFAATESALCGIQIGPDATMDLTDGLVAHNPIGVNLQNAELTIQRLSNDVLYRDNDVPLDSSFLPLPMTR